jgi:2-hydroxymuconate-semialdehyde hydrolase
MRRTAAALIHDQSLITEDYLAQRMQVIGNAEYQQYFDAMFAGDLRDYLRATTLSPAQLAAVQAPVLMIHGRQDLAFPAEHTSLQLAPQLASCDVMLLDRCSHSVALEHPDKLVALCALHYS